MNFRNTLYALACLSFCIMIGAGIYEHAALWPAAFSAPPQSLSVFQGEFKLNAPAFWMPIHPITMLLLIVTLTVSWKTERKKHVLYTIVGYFAILVITFSFFVPELIDITTTPYSDTVDQALQSRGSRWITLSLIRAAVLVGLAIMLLLGLTKDAERK